MPRESANLLRCPMCKESPPQMKEGFWPWKPKVAFVMKCTLILFPMALYLMSRPDYYECPKCHHKKGSLWV